MRVLLVIDSCGGGGAQRQLVELACSLKVRGHTVEFFMYYPEFAFFRKRLESCAIPIHESHKRAHFGLGVWIALLRQMRSGQYDLVLSYLTTPNIYTEICSVLSPKVKVVVSERASFHAEQFRFASFIRRALHGLADHVVTNSISQRDWLESHFRWLNGKVSTIYNGLNVLHFAAAPLIPSSPRDIELIGVGRVEPNKNILNLVRALQQFNQAYGWVPKINWVGRHSDSASSNGYWLKVQNEMAACPDVANRWTWLGERDDVPALIARHHALVHPSWHEGLPNVVCEALATGRPVLISDVCDHRYLVEDGIRGFRFDPHDVGSMVRAMFSLCTLTPLQWAQFSENARQYAESNLAIDDMASKYEALFSSVLDA